MSASEGDGLRPQLAELVALRRLAQRPPPPRRGRAGNAGQAPSPLRGRGMEYAESREYVAGDGSTRSYTAEQTDLVRWVHLAFTDAFLRSHQAYGGPIPGGPDAYVADWATAGRLMRVTDPPLTDAAPPGLRIERLWLRRADSPGTADCGYTAGL